jgi:predicted MarR family transcription regulator
MKKPVSRTPRRTEPPSLGLDRHWHLATNDFEIGLSELEFSIFRVTTSFERWQADCMGCAHGGGFSGSDTALLHVVRMHERPKSISELGRLLKRDDLANLQYSVRKLLKAGLIQRSQRSGKAEQARSKKDVTYEVTAEGRDITDVYARFRSEPLLSMLRATNSELNFSAVATALNLMSAMYDQAASVAAVHRRGE